MTPLAISNNVNIDYTFINRKMTTVNVTTAGCIIQTYMCSCKITKPKIHTCAYILKFDAHQVP